jgi:hypothetical protein
MDAQSTDRPVYPVAEGEREALQRLPAPVIDSAWEIYRFELLYFDPEFQRWQLFQEGRGIQENSVVEIRRDHRIHIQSLLASLRAAFKCVPVGTPIQVVPDVGEGDKVIAVGLDSKGWQWLKEQADRDGVNLALAWSGFVKELRESALRDGLLNRYTTVPQESCSAQPIHRTWEDLLDEIHKWAAVLSAPGQKASLKLRASDARTLLSLLPILPHWDLFGAIRHGWEQTEAEPPASLWQEVGRLREPWYCTHVVLPDDKSDPSTASTKIVGHAITVEAVFADLAMTDPIPVWLSLQEYFKYAYEPKAAEQTFYRLYSLFMDRIQLELSSSGQHFYYFAYPVFSSLGRRHFLHVYVRPRQQAATAIDLWNAWRQLHKQLDWEDLRHVLVDELEQTDLARFQRRVMDEIEKISETRRIRDEADELIREQHCASLVANQIHLLFPIRCACDGTDLGLFQKPMIGSLIQGIPWNALERADGARGRDLRCRGNIEMLPSGCKYSQEAVPSAARVVWDEKTFLNPRPVQRVVAEGRRQRLITQQVEFCRVMWKSHAATRQLRLDKNKEAWKVKKSILVRKREALLKALGTANSSYKDRFALLEVKELLDVVDCESFFAPFFCLNFFDRITEKAWQGAYREIVGGSLHATLSEYIETGVVQLLLHTDEPKLTVDKYSLMTAYEPVWNRLVGSIPDDNHFQPTRDAVDSMHKCVLRVIDDCGSEPFPVGDIWKECEPTFDCRENFFSYEITSAGCIRSYLQLAEDDVVLPPPDNTTMRINLTSPAFGFGEFWTKKILAELRKVSSTGKLYATGCEVPLDKFLESAYHKPAKAYQVYVLIGLPLSESLRAMLEVNGEDRIPGVWGAWGNHVGNWGHAFLVEAAKNQYHKTFSLPDVNEYDGLPEAVQRCIDTLLLVNDQAYWTFLGLVIERYKV